MSRINIGHDDVEQFCGEDIVWHGRQFPHYLYLRDKLPSHIATLTHCFEDLDGYGATSGAVGGFDDLAEATATDQLDVVVIGGKNLKAVLVDIVEGTGRFARRCCGSLRSVLLTTSGCLACIHWVHSGFRVGFFVNLLNESVATVHLSVI